MTATPKTFGGPLEDIRSTGVRKELAEHDLPELADTMEEAEARAKASTFLRVLGHVQKQQQMNIKEYEILLQHYEEQHEARQQSLDRQMAWLKENLKGLFGMMDAGNKKSLNLLGGQVGTRKQQAELVVEDDEAVLEWAGYSCGYVIRTRRELNRKELRAYITQDRVDDMPPGVELVERPDVFFASPK